MLPRSGDVIRVGAEASPQFSVAKTEMWFRVIRVHDWDTYDGWTWLDGYQLDAAGDAVERRSIFVQINGLPAAQPASAWVTPAATARPVAVSPRAGGMRRRAAS